MRRAKLGITLYGNHARTPTQNAFVERLQRTFRDELDRRQLLPPDVSAANEALQRYLHNPPTPAFGTSPPTSTYKLENRTFDSHDLDAFMSLRLDNSCPILEAGGGPTDDKAQVIATQPHDSHLLTSGLNIRVANVGAFCRAWWSRDAEFLTQQKSYGAEIRCDQRAPH